jgi:hypothetical protein
MYQASSDANSCGATTYLIHHMFLPPQLPQEDDFDSSHEDFMLETTLSGLSSFKQSLPHAQHQIIDSVIAMITSLKATSDSTDSTGGISEGGLKEVLGHLCAQGEYIVLSTTSH